MDNATAWISTTWGIFAFLGAVVVFERRLGQWRKHRDRRGIRELLVGMAIVIVAASSLASILVVVFMLGDLSVRRFFGALAWGAFSALIALLVLWTPSGE